MYSVRELHIVAVKEMDKMNTRILTTFWPVVYITSNLGLTFLAHPDLLVWDIIGM